MAYSGQCLTSEALGGRSANRGACAQACRLPYDLLVDGRRRDLGERKYLLSPQDLMTFDLVPRLAEIGVAALKIEGRLKTPEYVAAATRTYRRAVDGLTTLPREAALDLQQVFSRGFSHGWLGGIDHQKLVRGLSPKKRGLFLGVVTAAGVKLEAPVKPGDGIVFDVGRPEEDESGGRVYEVWKDGRRVDSADGGLVKLVGDFKEVAGARVWKTDDPATRARLRATFETPKRRVPVDATVEGRVGAPLRLTFSDGTHRVSADSCSPLSEARSRPFTDDYLREHVGRLGATPFELRALDARVEGFLPVRELNDLRRRLAADFDRVRRAAPAPAIRPGALQRLRTPVEKPDDIEPQLIALCRSLDHIDAALAEGIRRLECDFENPKLYGDAVARARAAGAWIALAPPRVSKPGEGAIVKRLLECAPDALLARSLAHLGAGIETIGDFSLNAANDLAARWLLGKGLARLVPSYDLSIDQLEALLGEIPAGRFEVVAHQHMPMFHMEHCVIAAEISDGADATTCGRPCDVHKFELRDRMGFSHPLVADVGCRNTVYNAVAQSASPYLRRLLDLGVRWFRVELLRQDAGETRRLLRAYRDALGGREVWRDLKASAFFGITRGPLGE